jgi:peptidoglycan/xylan/chitin deacetylase (PgdA/CDA1 family)
MPRRPYSLKVQFRAPTDLAQKEVGSVRVKKERLVGAKTLWTAIGLLVCALPRTASAGTIALTFDDLPGLTILQDQRYIDYFNQTLLRKLRGHHFPAIGFVNEGKLDELIRQRQIANLERWTDAGMNLGNHTFSHDSPNEVGARAYVADIARGEPVIKTLLKERGKDLRWFRHPYLETGSPASVRQAVDGWLQEHGYRVAPVTVDAEDWEFAEPYDDAIARHDRPRQRRIRAEYLAYTAMRISWSQASARLLFGRDIAHVMLLHDTRLNADTLGDLARTLHHFHLRPVSLEEAMRDSAYGSKDQYAGKDGLNWLERWALVMHKDLPSAGDVDPPEGIQQQYDKVDNDRR